MRTITDAMREKIIAAVEAAMLMHPADVADRCLEAAEAGRSWRRVIDAAVRNGG